MHYIMVNPIHNIESNALFNFLTNGPYGRGGLNLKDKAILTHFKKFNSVAWGKMYRSLELSVL